MFLGWKCSGGRALERCWLTMRMGTMATFEPPAPLPPVDVDKPLLVDPRLLDGRDGKPRRISAKVRKAIKVLSGKSNISDAARAVGMSEHRLSRALKEPHVVNYIRTEVAAQLSSATPRAAQRMAELIDSSSARVSLDASTRVLGIDGFRPAETPVSVTNNNLSAGYVIVLGPREPLPRSDEAPTASHLLPSVGAVAREQMPETIELSRGISLRNAEPASGPRLPYVIPKGSRDGA